MQVQIDYRFVSLNDYISAERTNRHIAAKIKKTETEAAQKSASDSLHVRVYPVDVVFQWFRSDRRTDPDNIAFAQKFIFDGLVLAGVLRDDTWKSIASIKHEFNVSDRDYVIIDID